MAIEPLSVDAGHIERFDGEIDVDSSTDRAVYEAVRPLMGTLARELTMCLRYYGVTFRGAAPQQIMLAGGDSTEPRLRETIAESCNVEVLCDDEIETLSTMYPAIRAKVRNASGSHGAWAVAAGLSIRAFQARSSSKRTRRAA